MIITRTPLRVSFFGGGSDIPEFYENHSGLVVSTTINSYIYLAVNRCSADHVKVIYSKLELAKNVDGIEHDRVREAMKYFNIDSNLEIASFSDIPTKGTGLGSSSTFTVGLVNALHYLKYGKELKPTEAAELACHIEINRCHEPIGKQDQYAAAFGGFNAIYFNKKSVSVKPVQISGSTLYQLSDNLLCFNTGQTRAASTVLGQQVENLKKKINIDQIKSMVDMAKLSLLLLKQDRIDDFGALLDQSWQIKKGLSNNVSNDTIDEMYEIGIKAGALGGKILGAGGGGYLLFYVPQKNQSSVLEAMSKYNRMKFNFVQVGSNMWNL